MSQKPGKTPWELPTRLQGVARKWLNDCDNVEEVLEAVVLEQLLDKLPAEMRVWVRKRKPATTTKAGQLAEDYRQARRMTRAAT